MNRIIAGLFAENERIGTVVKCNPLIPWTGDSVKRRYYINETSSACATISEDKFFEYEMTITEMHESNQYAFLNGHNAYPRQALLVKGVDYE